MRLSTALRRLLDRPAAAGIVLWSALAAAYSDDASAEVNAGLINDFQDCTAQGWIGDSDSISLIASDGPNGAGDAYLRIVSSGQFGAGSRLAGRNLDPEWRGDYIGAGITGLRLNLNNLGTDNPAMVRIAFSSNGGRVGDWWVSKTAAGFELPPSSGWVTATFAISESDLTLASGGAEYSDVLANVAEIRVVVNPLADFRGATQAHSIGLDNLTLLGPVSGPALFTNGFETCSE